VAHKMPTTHVGCCRPAVLDGGSNPPISTSENATPSHRPGSFRLLVLKISADYAPTRSAGAVASTSMISRSPVSVR
jgi:hypothetical protein